MAATTRFVTHAADRTTRLFFLLVFVIILGACSANDPVEVKNKPPTTPSSPSPADSATGQSINPQLTWVCSDPEGKALTFDVYFDDVSPPESVTTGLTQNTHTPPTLEYETTYFWKVTASDNEGLKTSGKIWMFTTVANGAPVVPHTPSPAHLAVDRPVNLTLSWTCSDPELDPLTYDVYMGTSSGPGLVASDRSQPSYSPPELEYDADYYWRVVAKDGRNETSSPEWRFSTVTNLAPSVPTNPIPADGQGDRPLQITLVWWSSDPEADPLTYDVYFGESGNPPSIATSHATNSYVLGQLEYGPTYYWRIVAKDDHGNQTTGPVWSFRTLAGVWSPMTSNSTVSLQGIWGSTANDVHVVGGSGETLHYDGSTWSVLSNPTSNYIMDVWGLSPSNVFAVGERATILRYNGSSWTSMTNPLTSSDHLYGIWGTAMNNIYAVGSAGTIVHYNGTVWNIVTSPTAEWLYGMDGINSSNIYAFGNDGTLLRFNGSTWLTVDVGTTYRFYDGWGLGANDYYAVGYRLLLHYDGTNWTSELPFGLYDVRGIWGSASDDIFAACISGHIIHFDGTTWREMDSGTTEHFYGGVWGTSRSNVYAVGDDGTILHFGPP